MRYSNGIPVKSIDHMSNVTMSTSKYGVVQERTANNGSASTVLPNAITANKFEFDTDPTMNNDYMTRRNGIQRNARLSERQEQDSEISPLTDLLMPVKTRYRTSTQ